MIPALQKLIDEYDHHGHTKETFREILRLPAPQCATVLFSLLADRVEPKMKIMTLNVWAEWLKEWFPHLYAEPAAPLQAFLSEAAKHAQALEQQVRMGDILQLVPLNCQGEARVARRGAWWRVVAAHDYDRTKPPPATASNRPPSWFLKSLTRKEQGLPVVPGDKKSPFENIWIWKAGDLDYRILNICSFPKEFKPKDWLSADGTPVENTVKTTFDKS